MLTNSGSSTLCEPICANASLLKQRGICFMKDRGTKYFL